jgi:hypothetical protein
MKKDYIKPEIDITVLVMGNFCATFNQKNNTEEWDIEDEEDI